MQRLAKGHRDHPPQKRGAFSSPWGSKCPRAARATPGLPERRQHGNTEGIEDLQMLCVPCTVPAQSLDCPVGIPGGRGGGLQATFPEHPLCSVLSAGLTKRGLQLGPVYRPLHLQKGFLKLKLVGNIKGKKKKNWIFFLNFFP